MLKTLRACGVPCGWLLLIAIGVACLPGYARRQELPESGTARTKAAPATDTAGSDSAPARVRNTRSRVASRREADRFLLMMQGMAGISPNQSAWVRSKLCEGLLAAPMPCCGAPGTRPADDEHDCCRKQLAALDVAAHASGPDRSFVHYERLFGGHRGAITRAPSKPPALAPFLGSAAKNASSSVLPAVSLALASSEVSQPSARLRVEVLPAHEDASLPPPGLDFQDAAVKHYRVAAISTRVVYNRFSSDPAAEDYGAFNPDGKIFVLEEERERVLNGSHLFNAGHDPLFHGTGRDGTLFLKDPRTGELVRQDNEPIPALTVEPLVLRANQGDTVVIDFTNRMRLPSAGNHVIRAVADDEGARWDFEKGFQLRPGDTIEWRIGQGLHGLRIDNWEVVKDMVEVVSSNVHFDPEFGENTDVTHEEGALLAKLRILAIDSDSVAIPFRCVVHPQMVGELHAAGAAANTLGVNWQLQGASYDHSALSDPKDRTAPPITEQDPVHPGGYQLRYIVRIPHEKASQGTYLFHSQPVSFDNVTKGLERMRRQMADGLFGALIVEPPGSVYLDSYAYRLREDSVDGFGNYDVDASGYVPVNSGWAAIIYHPQTKRSFREHVLFFHDDLADRIVNSATLDPRAISYRFEGFNDIFTGHFGVNDRSMAYSAYTYGDASTPHPQFYVGDPMRYRIVHSGMGDQFHAFHHHAHRWRFQPGLSETGADDDGDNLTSPSKWGRPGHPEQPDLTQSVSTRIDSQTLGPGETFDVQMEGGAGGVQRTVGDVLIHCHIIEHVVQGMWTYARIYNTLQQPDGRIPGLAPLPDRTDEARRPPMSVDSLALAELVSDPDLPSPVPVTGPLAGQPLSDVEGELYPFLDDQLPPRGIPEWDKPAHIQDLASTNRANRWDWGMSVVDGRRLYLGENYDQPVTGPPVRHIIEARDPMRWVQGELVVRPGDTIQWQMHSGEHGLEIKDWRTVKSLFDVETVPGQVPFDADKGLNSEIGTQPGQVLARLKVKAIPDDLADLEAITYFCIVHGEPMSGRLWLRSDPYVHFGVGYPTVGEGIGANRGETDPDGQVLARPKLRFNPKDGRLAFPHLLPYAGRRPPFAPRTQLTQQPDGSWTTVLDHGQQGTAFLGNRIRDPSDKLGHPTGGGLAPHQPRNIKQFDVVALQLEIDYSTRTGRAVRGVFGTGTSDPPTSGTRNHTINTEGTAWSRAQGIPDLQVGDTVTWTIGETTTSGHGLEFDDWESARGHLEKIDVPDQQPFDMSHGRNDERAREAGTVLFKARLTSSPSPDNPLPFHCFVHPGPMRGQVVLDENPNSDQRGQIFVLRDDVPDIMAGRKPAEPLVIRVHEGDVVDIRLRSALVDDIAESFGYSKVGIHTHLVQYDVQSSDGAVGGLNYETSIRPSLEWDETKKQLVAIGAEEQVHEETVHYRWWCDSELGTVYFHDHSLLKNSLPHGLVGVALVEPPGTEFRNPVSSLPVYAEQRDGQTGVIRIAGTGQNRSGVATADIIDPDQADRSFREFVPVFLDSNNGRDSINLRYQPLAHRYATRAAPFRLKQPLSIDWTGQEPALRGGKATAWSTRLHGDPPTPRWRAMPGDAFRIRMESAGTNDIHTLGLFGHRWRYESRHPWSPLRNFVLGGVSEAFTFQSRVDAQSAPGDVWYGGPGTLDVADRGKWGIFRIHDPGSSLPRKADGTLIVYITNLDNLEGVSLEAGHEFHSKTGVAYQALEAMNLTKAQLSESPSFRFGTTQPVFSFSVDVEAVEPGDQGNVPSRAAFATAPEAFIDQVRPPTVSVQDMLVAVESVTAFRNGRTQLAPLTATGDARPPAEDVPVSPVLSAAPNPPLEGDHVFHLAALEVPLPVRSPRRAKQILGGDQGQWNPDTLTVTDGGLLEWRVGSAQTDHGVRILNWNTARDMLDILDHDVPFDATAGKNTEPSEEKGRLLLRARVKHVPENGAVIRFACVNGDMRGQLRLVANGSGSVPTQPILSYVPLADADIELADEITGKTRALGRDDHGRQGPLAPDVFEARQQEIEVRIGALRERLRDRFLKQPEPVVFRVAAPAENEEAKTVAVRLLNLLPSRAEVEMEYGDAEATSPFGKPYSPLTSLHAHLAEYSLRHSQGSAMGWNEHSLVIWGDSRNYRWRVDRELGACLLSDAGDWQHQTSGLIAALIVEPAGAEFKPGHDGRTGFEAVIDDGQSPFREFVLFLTDNFPDGKGEVRINYQSARGFRALPPTPHLRARADETVRVRVLHAAGHGDDVNIAFFLGGQRWKFDLRDQRQFPSNRTSSVSLAPTAVYNLEFRAEAAVRPEQSLYGSRVGRQLVEGAWGVFTVSP